MASIKKRNNSFLITVSCGYDVTGKKILRTMTYKPEKDMTEKQALKEAERSAALFEEKVKSGTAASGGNIRLADFIPQYFENAEAELSPTTLETYKRIIRDLIIPALGHAVSAALQAKTAPLIRGIGSMFSPSRRPRSRKAKAFMHAMTD